MGEVHSAERALGAMLAVNKGTRVQTYTAQRISYHKEISVIKLSRERLARCCSSFVQMEQGLLYPFLSF